MPGKKMEKSLNGQLNAELYSSYLYLSMCAYFLNINLGGFGNWMRVQAQEELMHAMKFYDFINQRGGRALLKAIEGPPTDWKSPLAAFEAVLEHEQTGQLRVHPGLRRADRAQDALDLLQYLRWRLGALGPPG